MKRKSSTDDTLMAPARFSQCYRKLENVTPATEWSRALDCDLPRHFPVSLRLVASPSSPNRTGLYPARQADNTRRPGYQTSGEIPDGSKPVPLWSIGWMTRNCCIVSYLSVVILAPVPSPAVLLPLSMRLHNVLSGRDVVL